MHDPLLISFQYSLAMLILQNLRLARNALQRNPFIAKHLKITKFL